jgi:hypothetical protein
MQCLDESKYEKYKGHILEHANWIKEAIENLEKIKGISKIIISKKDFFQMLGKIEDFEEDVFNSALKLFLYKKGLIVEQDTDTYTFQKVTFSIMVRGIIEDVNKDVLIIKIGNAKIWVSHFPKWDYLPGAWIEMKGRYCGTVVLGDMGMQQFICEDLKMIDIKNIDR